MYISTRHTALFLTFRPKKLHKTLAYLSSVHEIILGIGMVMEVIHLEPGLWAFELQMSKSLHGSELLQQTQPGISAVCFLVLSQFEVTYVSMRELRRKIPSNSSSDNGIHRSANGSSSPSLLTSSRYGVHCCTRL